MGIVQQKRMLFSCLRHRFLSCLVVQCERTRTWVLFKLSDCENDSISTWVMLNSMDLLTQNNKWKFHVCFPNYSALRNPRAIITGNQDLLVLPLIKGLFTLSQGECDFFQRCLPTVPIY